MSDIARVYGQRREDYLRVATAITGDRESASDALHEAFVNAISGRERFRAEGSLEGWIWAIVINLARDQRRRSRHYGPVREAADAAAWRSRTLPDAAGVGSCAEDAMPAVEHTALRAQVADLPERQRLVLFLRFYADLDYAQIGRVVGISTGTVGATLNAALRALHPAQSV